MAMFRFLPYCFAIRRLGVLFRDIVSDCDAKSGRRVALAAANRYFSNCKRAWSGRSGYRIKPKNFRTGPA
jgi:hypothetical protein